MIFPGIESAEALNELDRIAPAKKYTTTLIGNEITGASLLRNDNKWLSLLVKGNTISAFARMVKGAQAGAVNKSANPPPITAATIAYGCGNKTAARKMNVSPK